MNISLPLALRACAALCLSWPAVAPAKSLPVQPASSVVADYLQQAKASQQPAELLSSVVEDGVEVRMYRMVSQQWPGAGSGIVSNAPLWEQQYKLVLPLKRKPGAPVLLYVNGGSNHAQPPKLPDRLPAEALARDLGVPVAELYFVPNQELQLDEQPTGREDALVAYTWRKTVDQPQAERFSSLHLPMTQAVSATMDALQRSLPGSERFVVAGASKRGWATWLAGLNDKRVSAIVPVVADFWNVRDNFTHVYNSYGQQWPVALRDYQRNGITEDVLQGGAGLDALLKFEDVVNYRASMARLSKYMISASGDDFAVPDSAWSYLPAFTGPTQLRYLPNQSHYVKGDQIGKALRQFMRRWLAGKPMPQAQVDADSASGRLRVSVTGREAGKATLWLAHNPKSRDFRFNSGIRYQPKPIEGQCRRGSCRFEFKPDASLPGWQAYFIEFEGQDFAWSTPPLVWPHAYPSGEPVPFGAPRLQLGR
ncbi:PhoPQ-activated protein PqaA family protein [Chromobacterium haemolyticum]|uniref:PhoPQ-activated protein PqaA family protein n=1 Tax=Chromobacterium haemolyticum TaxID=394935 RepID=UPI000316C868|nr:PhoPQ-activated protein PqaA family protein [Chromobacterium haemolyticum]